MLPPLQQRAVFQAICFTVCDPALKGFCHRDADACWSVNTLLHFMARRHGPSVGIFFSEQRS